MLHMIKNSLKGHGSHFIRKGGTADMMYSNIAVTPIEHSQFCVCDKKKINTAVRPCPNYVMKLVLFLGA